MKYYYDCPIIAAYMMKYQRINFGEGIHAVFDYLCTTDAQIAATPVKFYLNEKSVLELNPEYGDEGIDETENQCFFNAGAKWVAAEGGEVIGKCTIDKRDGKAFFMPKEEEDANNN